MSIFFGIFISFPFYFLFLDRNHLGIPSQHLNLYLQTLEKWTGLDSFTLVI